MPPEGVVCKWEGERELAPGLALLRLVGRQLPPLSSGGNGRRRLFRATGARACVS